MKRVLIALVKAYRLTLSPWLGSACRFTPTCSVYSLEALETRGAVVGTLCAFGGAPTRYAPAHVQAMEISAAEVVRTLEAR